MASELPLDRIRIHDLLLRCIIGANDDERVKKPDVNIDITLHCDLSGACSTDDLADTVDYKALKLRVVEMVEGSQHFLIERLADEIASVCLAEERVQRVDVRVEKPGALRFARTVSVEITRGRE